MDVVPLQQKWIGASNLKEKTASQSHFNDLCDLLGVPKPLDANHTGDRPHAWEKCRNCIQREIAMTQRILGSPCCSGWLGT